MTAKTSNIDTQTDPPKLKDFLMLVGLFIVMIFCMQYQNKIWHDHNDACNPICSSNLDKNQHLLYYSKTSLDTGANFTCECKIQNCKTDNCTIYSTNTLYIENTPLK